MLVRTTALALSLLLLAACSEGAPSSDGAAPADEEPQLAQAVAAEPASTAPAWKRLALAERDAVAAGLVTGGVAAERHQHFKVHVLDQWTAAFDTNTPPGCAVSAVHSAAAAGTSACIVLVMKKLDDGSWSVTAMGTPGEPEPGEEVGVPT
jgi:hypothetical protein